MNSDSRRFSSDAEKATHQDDEAGKPVYARHLVECVEFVRMALTIASADVELSPSAHADASGLCRVLLELAVDKFGVKGKDVLMEWGITCSEDVGLIMHRLIEIGIVQTNSDTLEDFVGLFDLTLPPETWKLQW